MAIRAHDELLYRHGQSAGYRVRIGRTLPPEGANLAYVDAPTPTPATTIHWTDYSDQTPENRSTGRDRHRLVLPDDTFRLRETTGVSTYPTDRLHLTDEFSIPASSQEEPAPLYYRAELTGRVDARQLLVSPYPGGYHQGPVTDDVPYSQLRPQERQVLLYQGDQMQVTLDNGEALTADDAYKIQLVRQESEDAPNHQYRIFVYTNFRGTADRTYHLHYRAYTQEGTYVYDESEVINAYPFFTEVAKSEIDDLAEQPKVSGQWRDGLMNKEYAVEETDDHRYAVYAPSQMVVADLHSRPTNHFSYRVQGEMTTKFSRDNPGTLRIGMVYHNEAVYGMQPLGATLKRLNESNALPPYLTLENPHPERDSMLKEEVRYWLVDLDMPTDDLEDYDVLILTGYGTMDLDRHNTALRSFLATGGTLWVDNASHDHRLQLDRSLLRVGFGSQAISGSKRPSDGAENAAAYTRLFSLDPKNASIGYSGVNTQITFGAGEDLSFWTPIVSYAGGDPAVMQRRIETRGQVVVSNCGLFRSVFDGDRFATRMVINMLLDQAETQWFMGPWKSDAVYHRNNLFDEEYEAFGTTHYIDGRSDDDATQIVAKKILAPSTEEAMMPYLPEAFQGADGDYSVDMQADSTIPIANSHMENGSYDESTDSYDSTWTSSTDDAIPNWHTRYRAGTTPSFEHRADTAYEGDKALYLHAPSDDLGSLAYWYTTTPTLRSGSYRAEIMLRVQDIDSTQGAAFGVFDQDGSTIRFSDPVRGNQEYQKVTVSFALTSDASVDLAVGFLDSEGIGHLWADQLRLYRVGNVHMTAANDGTRPLYAYTVRPQGEIFDLDSQGFKQADVTTFDPAIPFTYTVRAFVYRWDNTLGRYIKEVGNHRTYETSVRRSDGIKTLGVATTKLPGLPSGQAWADRNQVRYEVYVGDPLGADAASQLVNIGIFNTETSEHYYNRHGDHVVTYPEIFQYGRANEDVIILQASTNFYTVRATKRRYGLLVQGDDRIYPTLPRTNDQRDAWHIPIHRGAFRKEELSDDEEQQVKALGDQAWAKYQGRTFGVHQYMLPEFDRQVFEDGAPYRRRYREQASYIDEHTIQVARTPIYLQQGTMAQTYTRAIGSSRRVFQAPHGHWLSTPAPVVYHDKNGDGDFTTLTEGLTLDYDNGIITLDDPIDGNLAVDYAYDNFDVFARGYTNDRVKEERLQSADGYTFTAAHAHWLLHPPPVIYLTPYGQETTSADIAPVDSYTIDYDAGTIRFDSPIDTQVMATYTFATHSAVAVRDVDIHNGTIYLDEPVHFADDLFVNYTYEETFVTYRGYYDDDEGRFMHLDLNPSPGHFCTLPTGMQPTAQLLNKEVYLYLRSHTDSYGGHREQTIRHVFGQKRWERVKRAHPSALLLGVFQVREPSTVQDVTVMDARSRGGGLADHVSRRDIDARGQEHAHYWDLDGWDGDAFYQNGVLVVRLPKTLRLSDGGSWTESEIRDIVERHAAFGVHVIIHYVDDTPTTTTAFLQGASFPASIRKP